MNAAKNPTTLRVLIIDDMHPAIIELLGAAGIETDYKPTVSKQELVALLPNYQGLILRSKIRLEREILQFGTQLQVIARAGAGVDEIDEQFLKERNIFLINAPEGNRDAVGEHTIGMMLSLLNHFNRADKQVRQLIWDREGNRGVEIKGKTIGVIGYGNMGKAVAKRLVGFGAEVVAYDKFRHNYGDQNAREVPMEYIFEKADIVTYHIPLYEVNRRLVSVDYLRQFKKPIYLLNLARGEVMPFASVRYGLENNLLIAAALDVLENEKLNTLTPEQRADFDYLAASDRVLFTPHVGGWTFESYQRISEVLGQKLLAFWAKS